MALPPAIRRPLVAWGVLPALDAAPIREASPGNDDALPPGGMVSRDPSSSWLPAAWDKRLLVNDDEILNKGGVGLTLYDQLLDDDVAMSTLQQRRLAIIEREWEVVPGDDKDPRSVQAADDLRAMLKEVGWDRITGLMHFAVWYGYGVGEAMYKTKLHDGRQIVWLDDIVIPDRRWFGFNAAGELRMVGTLTSAVEGDPLPDNKFWTIRTGASHDFAFYGLGLAHWCYWPIFFKRACIRFWALFLEKYGQPTVGIEFPESEKDDEKRKSARLQAAVAVGQDRAVLVPEGTLSNDKMKILEAARTGGAGSYKEFLDEQNEALMRIVLGQPGTSKATPGGLGGDGQAKKDEATKRTLTKSDSDLISESFNRTVARWLTIWNHGPDVAPPKVWRKLEDEEDLSSIAERDSKLDGIGIKRTEKSVADVYGEGYELDRVSEAEKAAQAAELAAAKGPPVAQPKGNPNGERAAEFAARFDVQGKAPLYVSRAVLSEVAEAIHAWAIDAGIPNPVSPDDLHATLLYSKTPVDWFAMGDYWGGQLDGKLTVNAGGPRAVVQFDGGAIVLRFASADMTYRHDSMIERGASSDHAEYKPHITVGRVDDGQAFDVGAVEPFQDAIEFGPEIFEPIEIRDPYAVEFAADELDAIDRLVGQLLDETSPVFAAMAGELRDAMAGVSTVEGARVALLEAMEKMPVERLANLTALPMLVAMSGGMAGE